MVIAWSFQRSGSSACDRRRVFRRGKLMSAFRILARLPPWRRREGIVHVRSRRPRQSSRSRPRVAAAARAAVASAASPSPRQLEVLVLRSGDEARVADTVESTASQGGPRRGGPHPPARRGKIPPSLLRALAHHARAQGREVDAVLIDALQTWLWDHAVSHGESPVAPPSNPSARRAARASVWRELDDVLGTLRCTAS
jgi:hypothetical protein